MERLVAINKLRGECRTSFFTRVVLFPGVGETTEFVSLKLTRDDRTFFSKGLSQIAI